MTIFWLVAGASLVASLVTLREVRRAAKRLDELSQLYWELRYQQGELLARVQGMTGETAPPSSRPVTPARGAPEAFVPLSAVRR